MNNPLPREQREMIKKVTKYLMCCGFTLEVAHTIAEAEVLANLIANLQEA